MQELFFTILVIWLLFKIFGSRAGNTFTFNTYTNYQKPEAPSKPGEVKINVVEEKKQKQKNEDDGEYVDFEEIK